MTEEEAQIVDNIPLIKQCISWQYNIH